MKVTILDDENLVVKNVAEAKELADVQGSVAFESWHQVGQKYTKVGEVREPAYPDPEPLTDKEKIQALKDIRNASLSAVIVEIDGNNIGADPTEEQNISGRLRQLEADGKDSCKWIQGTDVYVLSKAQLELVLVSGTAQCAVIYDDYIEAIEAL